MAAEWVVELSCNQNEDTTFVTVWADYTVGPLTQLSQAVPRNFTGAVGYLQISTSAKGTALLTLTSLTTPKGITFGGPISVPDGVNTISMGTITITLTNEQTLALPTGQYYYDLLVVQNSDNTYYMSGNFNVLPTQARV
jgi:hypothetical protein